MTRKAMTVMALVLLAATVATAATAFAGAKHRCNALANGCFGIDPVMQQVIAANNATSQAMLRLKMKAPPFRQRGFNAMVKPAGFSAHPMPTAPVMLPIRR